MFAHRRVTCDRSHEHGFPVLTVSGRIATPDVSEVEAEIEHLEEDTEDCAIIDLTEVPYITSRGFPIFILCQRRLNARGHHLFLAVSEEGYQLFEVLRLHTRLSLYRTRDECVAAARATRGTVGL